MLAIISRGQTLGGRRMETRVECYPVRPSPPAWDQEDITISPGMRNENVSQGRLATRQVLPTPPHLSNRYLSASGHVDGYDRPELSGFSTTVQRIPGEGQQAIRSAQSTRSGPFHGPRMIFIGCAAVRQYSTSSRLLSVESVATVVEKWNSPLDKEMDRYGVFFRAHSGRTQ